MSDLIINEQSYSFTNFIKLTSNELQLVWNWRNHDSIRKWMYYSEIIPWEDHIKFIAKLKDIKDKIYFLVKREGIPTGVFSIVDINEFSGEWGYYIAPEYHDQNHGVEFYYYSLQFIFEILNFRELTGYALKDNYPANSLNDLFGFTKILEYKEIHRLLELTKNKHLK